MPIHDWTRVPSGLFHHFHQDWSIEIARTLNRGVLSSGYYALVEQRVDGPEPDVIAVETSQLGNVKSEGGTLVLERPQTTLSARLPTDATLYARRANLISVRHPLGEVVAIIEIVSPGNKDSRNSLRSFVDKAVAFLRGGVNLLIVDLFPPSARDPQGIHKAIWGELTDELLVLPPGKPLTLVGYEAGGEFNAYIEPLAVGDAMPDMPLFIAPGAHVLVPLDATYRATWEVCPRPIREMVLAIAD